MANLNTQNKNIILCIFNIDRTLIQILHVKKGVTNVFFKKDILMGICEIKLGH